MTCVGTTSPVRFLYVVEGTSCYTAFIYINCMCNSRLFVPIIGLLKKLTKFHFKKRVTCTSIVYITGKGKGHPRTGHEGPEVE